jgi:hypothetical protein
VELTVGINAASFAIVNTAGRVVTFVRPDVPEGWSPPDGCTAVPADQLPAGWQYAADDSPVPATISARQARLWLIRHGITLAQVDAVIASIPDAITRESVRVEWEYGTEVHRSSAWLAALGPALGLDASTLDTAFREAAAI